MVTVLSEGMPKARKAHRCDASECLLMAGIDVMDFTMTERRALVMMRRNGWRILKGQRYTRQSNVREGRLYTFKASPEMHQLCLDYDLYE